jgi:DNA-binding SARP family transcriptional activator/TolB-like protein
MLSLRLFGGASIRVEGEFLGGEAGQTRRVALLALLATSPAGAMTREKLIGYLWPETATEQARRLLSESLYVLRRSLSAEALLSEGELVRANPDLITCDVRQFEAALERGDLEDAVSAYGGPFLDGFYVREAPEFERWVESERRRYADSYATALENLAEVAEEAEDHLIAVGRWKRLIAHDPYNSRYVLRLMQAMVAAGDPANAIQQAEEHTRVLEQDLGMEPPRDLVALAEQLREEPIPQEITEVDRDTADRAAGEPLADIAVMAVGQRSRLPTQRTLVLAVLAATTLCGAISVLWIVIPRQGPGVVPENVSVDPTNRLAVLPFTYHGSEEFAYLGETMDELLGAMLDGVGDLRNVPSRTVLAMVSAETRSNLDPDSGGRLAERLGAGHHISGDVVEVDGQLRINVWLHSGYGARDSVVAASAEGELTNFYDLVDDLTRQLVLALVGSLKDHERLAVRTTGSHSALKAYLEGVGHYRAQRMSNAVTAFQRAVEIDSTFALAWYGISDAGAWPNMMEYDAAVEAGERAERLSERLPPGVKDLLSVSAAYMRGDAFEAERLSRELLSRYQSDAETWWLLAVTLSNFGDYYGRPESEAFAAYKRARLYNPSDINYQRAGFWVAAQEGDWVTFDSLTSVFFGEDSIPFEWRAVRAFGAEYEAAQQQILAEARERNDARPLVAAQRVVEMVGDVTTATELARLAVLDAVDAEPQALLRIRLAGLELAVGRWRAAQAQLALVAPLRPKWATLYRALWAASPSTPVTEAVLRALRDTIETWDAGAASPSVTHTGARAHDVLAPQLRLYALGRLSWRLGDREETLRRAAELEALGNRAEALTYAIDRALSLRAHVLYDDGQLEEALATLESQPRRLRPQYIWEAMFYQHSEDRFLRGEILSRLGRLEEALRWYEVIDESFPYYRYDYTGLAYLRRGETSARMGQHEMAIAQYKRFIGLWRDCDSELRPLVEQARQALERLTSEPAAP